MNDPTLRPCRYGDLKQVLSVEEASFPDSPYSRLDFAFFLARPRTNFTLAIVDEKLAGYVIATGNLGNGMVQSIAVSPGFRRRGIGESLMKSAMESLSRYERVYLLVDRANTPAIALYHKFSFKETGEVKRAYYPNGADAIEMMRETVTEEFPS